MLPVPGTMTAPVLVVHEAMSERELVSRAQRGDEAAFEALYRTHSPRIYGLCLRMVADPDRAEDLTQEAFLRAWEKLPSFRRRSAFSTWLHRLAVNVVLGDFRSRRRHGALRDRIQRVDGLPVSGPGRQPETGIDLERAIALLPPQARLVFVLHDVEGLRHSEIAARMELAEGTSKAHLHRARRLLREALKR